MSDIDDEYIVEFLIYIQSEKGLSKNTVQAYKRDITDLYLFIKKELLSWLPKKSDIRAYMSFLHQSSLQLSSQARKMVAIKVFLKFLFRENYIDENIAPFFETAKRWQKIPATLNYNEIEAILHSPNLDSEEGILDKALFEILYGTGIRVSELCSLSLYDITDDAIRVRGKGGKERVVPIGEKALTAIDRYLNSTRSSYESDKNSILFLTSKGKPITRAFVWRRVHEHRKKLGLTKDLSPHVFRHTYASHLLDAGADVRIIQDLLGHAHISSTDRYTQLSSSQIQELFHIFHPRWKSDE